MTEKQLDLAGLIGEIQSGTSVAFGGGGLQRKPMSAAHAIARTVVSDLEVISFLGGPEVDLLIATKKVRRLHFAFVGFDALGLAPHFRNARENGTLEAVEYSEATMLSALEAAARDLPFLPTRFALGTDLMTVPTSPFKTCTCPFTGEELLAVPALRPDVAIVHANIADRAGNAVILGDAFADSLLVRAAGKAFVTAEKIVDALPPDIARSGAFISRLWVSGVVELPGGTGMTGMYPDRLYDMPTLVAYQKNTMNAEWLQGFVEEIP